MLMPESVAWRGALRSDCAHSGRKTLALPGTGNTTIIQTVVQSARPALPEFHSFRQQTITAPIRRTVRLFIQKPLLGFGQ